MKLNDMFVMSSFIADCKSTNTLRVFKAIVTKNTDTEEGWGPNITEEQLQTDYSTAIAFSSASTMQEEEESEGGEESTSTDQKYHNPWYYFPVHIDDDVLTIKIAGADIAESSRIYLAYDQETPAEPNTTTIDLSLLAIVIPLNYNGRILENSAENYICLSLKGLSGLSCRFDTFDEQLQLGEADPPVNPNNNVFKLTPTTHRHSDPDSLISPNEEQDVLVGKYSNIQEIAPNFTRITTEPIFYPDGGHTIGNGHIDYNLNWIQELGNSYYFYTDTTIATQEDELFLQTETF